jgi:ribosome assembly protein 4
LSTHTACITKVIWGGSNHIYTASEDRLIKVWDDKGNLIRELKGHGHWVNTIALSTDYALRTGCFSEK